MPKPQNNPMSNPISAAADSYGATSPPPAGNAQEAVSPYPRPDEAADALGNTPRKKTRSAIPGVEADALGNTPRKKTRSAVSGVEADARGNTPRKKTRSAVSGVEADARSHAPRKKTRPVGRGGRSRDRRPRRRSLALAANAGPSLPRLSPDSRDRDGEIALLRSLTNRLLSKRPLDHVQISRYLRILVRAFSANSLMPRELTDEEQVDNLIKKVFQDNVDKGNLGFHDLVPVRMARPGEKWWPWRELLPLKSRWRYGLIDPDERWPHEENKRLAESEAMDRAMAKFYLGGPLDDDSLSVIPAPEPVEDAESAPLACAERRESIPRNEADPPTARRTARARPRPP